MNFQIYVLGDVDSFVAVLNGVAIIFKDGGFMNSVFLLGGLIMVGSIMLFLLNRVSEGGVVPGLAGTGPGGIFGFAAIVATCGITSTVSIEDIYTGNIAAVDHVPIIISVPASIFTTASYKIFDKSNTAYQSVNGSYMGVSQSGYIMPLKLLFSLRRGVEQVDPYLTASLKQYILDCVPGSSTLTLDGFKNADDLVGYVLDNGRPNGLTTYYNQASPTGTGLACVDSAAKIRTDVQTFVDGPKLLELVNNNVKEKSPSGGAFGQAAVNDAIQNVALNAWPGATQASQQFMTNALFFNTVSDTFRCLDNNTSQADFNNCNIVLTQASEQWKVDSAAAGSLFAKTMMPAMIFLQIMFFGFAPIIIVFGIFKGGGAVGMYVKYLGFGVWTSSWLPFSAVIQMYIQNDVADKLAALTTHKLVPGNFDAFFYDILSTRLAIASDMLAATPMVAGALLGIGGAAMAGLASRFSAKDYVDEKQAAPALMQQSAINMVTGRSTTDANTGLTDKVGASIPELSASVGNTASQASANATRNSTSSALRSSLEASVGQEAKRNLDFIMANGSMTANRTGNGYRVVDGKISLGGSSDKGSTMSAEQFADMKAGADAAATFTAGLTQNMASQLWKDKSIQKALGSKGSQEALEKGLQGSIQAAAAKDASFMSRFMSGDSDAIETAINGVGTGLMIAGAVAAPETLGLGGLAGVAGRGALMMAAPKIARGASTFIKGAGRVAESIGAAGSAASAIFGTGQSSQQAAFKVALGSSEGFRNASADKQSDMVKAAYDASSEIFHEGGTSTTTDHSQRRSDSTSLGRSEALRSAFSQAAESSAAVEDTLTRQSAMQAGSDVKQSFTPQKLAQFFGANRAQTAEWDKHLESMEGAIAGKRSQADAAIQTAGMTPEMRKRVVDTFALQMAGQAISFGGRPDGLGMNPGSNSNLRAPDGADRLDAARSRLDGVTAPQSPVAGGQLVELAHGSQPISVHSGPLGHSGGSPVPAGMQPLPGASQMEALKARMLSEAHPQLDTLNAGNPTHAHGVAEISAAQRDQLSVMHQAGNVWDTDAGKVIGGTVAIGTVVSGVTNAVTTRAGVDKGIEAGSKGGAGGGAHGMPGAGGASSNGQPSAPAPQSRPGPVLTGGNGRSAPRFRRR